MTIDEIAASEYGLCIEECEYLEDKSVWIATLSNGITAYQDDDKSGKEPVAWRRLHKYCKDNNVHVLGLCLKFRSNIITIKTPEEIDGFYFAYGAQREFDEEVTRAYYVCGYLKNEEINLKFEKVYKNIPDNTYLILQNIKKPDSRLKSTKFIKKLIKENVAIEKSFSLPDVWDYEGQRRYLEDAAKEMDISLDKKTAELIIDSVGNDSVKLMSELAKAKIYLTALAKDKNAQLCLKSNDVKNIFNDHQSNIFKIIDLLLEKNIKESLIEIQYLLSKGEPPLRLNSGLISQIRIH